MLVGAGTQDGRAAGALINFLRLFESFDMMRCVVLKVKEEGRRRAISMGARGREAARHLKVDAELGDRMTPAIHALLPLKLLAVNCRDSK